MWYQLPDVSNSFLRRFGFQPNHRGSSFQDLVRLQTESTLKPNLRWLVDQTRSIGDWMRILATISAGQSLSPQRFQRLGNRSLVIEHPRSGPNRQHSRSDQERDANQVGAYRNSFQGNRQLLL